MEVDQVEENIAGGKNVSETTSSEEANQIISNGKHDSNDTDNNDSISDRKSILKKKENDNKNSDTPSDNNKVMSEEASLANQESENVSSEKTNLANQDTRENSLNKEDGNEGDVISEQASGIEQTTGQETTDKPNVDSETSNIPSEQASPADHVIEQPSTDNITKDSENHSETDIEINEQIDVVDQEKDTENKTDEPSLSTNLEVENISEDSDANVENNGATEAKTANVEGGKKEDKYFMPVSPAASPEPVTSQIDDISDAEEEVMEDEKQKPVITTTPIIRTSYPPLKKPIKVVEVRAMVEDIEEGELDYEEEEGELAAEIPEPPEYVSKKDGNASEEGEIISDGESDDEREEGEIRDDDETGQVYICVDQKNDRWKKVSRAEQKRLQEELEDGQIAEEPVEELPPETASPPQREPPGRFIPRTLCKYFNNGLCRWGSTCRFLHPGINDQGIPKEMQPTWNATAGNYAMHRPPGMYPSAFGRAPSEVMPPPQHPGYPPEPPVYPGEAPVYPGQQPDVMAMPIAAEVPVKKESAWEKGLRRAKEIKEAAARRRKEDTDFEQKRMSMRIPETDLEKESDFEPGADPALSAERTLNEWSLNEAAKPSNEYADRLRDDRRYERGGNRSDSKNAMVDKSSGRARLATLPLSHPIRREERQRQREREKREREEKERREKEKEMETMYNKQKVKPAEVSDPRTKSHEDKMKAMGGATDWVDPWMRTQPQTIGYKPDAHKTGVEAISDSSSSSSDSDSDSDSSSSDKSSDSSDSSDDEKKKKQVPSRISFPIEPKNRKERREQFRQHKEARGLEKNEPLSYKEWKRLQTMQKAQYHQQLANQYKSSVGTDKPNKEENSSQRVERVERIEKVVPETRTEEKRSTYQQDPRVANTLSKRPPVSKYSKPEAPPPVVPPKPTNMGNDDKFDSPKRKADSDSDSDSASDSDSDSSDSDSSDSDSDDSDSDSDSDVDMKAKMAAAAPVKQPLKPPPMDTTARKDIKLQLNEKPKVDIPVLAAIGGKRPARKDELLKELKAVEDAIARKRAKID